MELADVTDSKSVGSDTVRVRPPPPAPKQGTNYDTMGITIGALFFMEGTTIKDFEYGKTA